MKKSLKISGIAACVAFGLSLFGSTVFGQTDYSTMSNNEMAQIRSTMRDASPDDQEAFRVEWQKRIQTMSQEEKQTAVGRPENAPQDGTGNRHRQGAAGGGGAKSNGGGMGKGRR